MHPGELSRDKLDFLRRADAIYIDAIRRAGLYDAIWQAFAVLLPVRTVGVVATTAPTTTSWGYAPSPRAMA